MNNPPVPPSDEQPLPGPEKVEAATLALRSLAVLAGLLLVAFLVWLPGQMFLHESLRLEKRALDQDVNRVVQTLQNEVLALDNLSADWSNWDNAYAFVKDRNAGFIKENLGWDSLLTATKINLLVFLDERGHVVWSGFRQRLSGPLLPVPSCLTGEAPAPIRDGFLVTPEGPLMVTRDPILPSNGSGASRGTLYMGRLLEEKIVARLASRENLAFRLECITFLAASGAGGKVPARLRAGRYEVQYGRDTATIRTFLPDLSGDGGLLVTIPWPRDIYQQGRRAAIAVSLLTLLGMGGLAAGFGLWFFWQNRERARIQADLGRLVNIRTAELREANHALQEASMVDSLTGLKNRRFLDLSLPSEIERTLRVHRAKSLPPMEPSGVGEEIIFLILDIDHFKRVNDTYGHAAGDAVLHEVGRLLQQTCRTSDVVARWGGEEFLVTARRTHHGYAPIIAEKMLEAFRQHRFLLPGGEPLQVRCSVGYCPFPVLLGRPQAIAWTQAVEIADMCLYLVKRNGRDGWAGPVVPEEADLDKLAQGLPGGFAALVEEGALSVHSTFEGSRLPLPV